LREDLRWLAAEIGRARDLDVFMDDLLRPVRRGMPGDADLQILTERAAQARAEAYELVRAAFSGERYTGTLLELARFVECRAFGGRADAESVEQLAAPAASFAAQFLTMRHQKARKRGRHFTELPAGERHRLRLAIKKLRYGAEFFRSLYDQESCGPFLKRLSRLQSTLGHTSDVATARRLIDDLRRDAPAEEAEALGRAAGLIAGWHGRHAQDLEPKLKKQWKAFKATPPFWDGHVH
jgi:CHAD domain-containing protein